MASKHRRTSIDNWQNELLKRINYAKDNLSELWDEMALSESQREERLQDSRKLVLDLLDNMVTFEKQQLEDIKRKCAQYRKEFDEIRQELSLGAIDEASIPKGLAPCGYWLKIQLKALKTTKNERMDEQLVAYNEAKEACDRVGWHILANDDFTNHLVPLSRITEWKKQKIEADATFKDRHDKIRTLQAAIRKIVAHIGRDEFNDADLLLADMDYDKFDAILSEDLVDTFVQLQERANERYQLWYEKIQFEYDELMVELHDLWDLCAVAECERYFPKNFNPDVQTVGEIENVKNEIAQLKLKYTEGKLIYDKLREWLQIWNEKLQLDENSTNTKDKYHDRGGSLQARLKREAQLKNLVPKVLSELEALCENFAKSNENIPLIGPGRMHPSEYARWVVQSYEDEKTMNKLNKEEYRKAQLAQESRFGVSPSPSKSILHRTRITPASIRKTPRKATLGFNSSKLSQQSSIEPTSGPIDGPKTSSPKNLGLMYSPRRLMFSPALSVIPSSPLAPREKQFETPTKTPKSPSRPWRY